MNHYTHHLGDYLKDAGHLSLLEHGVYRRLLDVYYIREAPLPADQVYRLVGARTDEEREAVDSVLSEFFERDGNSWRQARCDREIAGYVEKSAQARAAANARWQQSDRKANVERTVSKPNATAMRPQCERNASHKPITSNQEFNPPKSPLPGDDLPQKPMDGEPEPKLPRSKASAKAEPDWFEEWWGDFCREYPPRSGDLKKSEGRRLALAKVRGDPERAEAILAGARRYRAWCIATGKVRTELVASIPPWLRGDRWESEYELPEGCSPPGAPSPRDAEREAMLEAVGL